MNELHTMTRKVRQTILTCGMIPPGSHVVAAVSGGADSLAMLHLLKDLQRSEPFTLSAAHGHHGLRGEAADADQALVERLCAEWNIPLTVAALPVTATRALTGEGEEECGRRLRYEFLRQTAGDGLIATAHTRNDAAETLLMNLIRGAGCEGLCGIPPVREGIIRPLIQCTRQEVEAYCRDNAIPFRVDETNFDQSYRRNFIRHRILPLCEECNPEFLAAAARTAAANTRDAVYLTRQGQALLLQAQTPQGYRLSVLQEAPSAVLYYALRQLPGGKGWSAGHLDALADLVRKGRGQADLPGAGWAADGRLLQKTPPPPAELCRPVVIGTPVETDNGTFCLQKVLSDETYICLDGDTIGKNPVLRHRLPGDRLHLPGRPGKSLKKWMNEAAFPPYQRDSLPVLADENGIIWVPGLGVDVRCVPTDRTGHRLAVCWVEKEKE